MLTSARCPFSHHPSSNKPVRTFLLFLGVVTLSLWAPHTYAQSTIQGQVVDVLGLPLPNVNLRLIPSEQGTATASNGQYQIEHIAPGSYVLRASAIGFETNERVIDIAPDTLLTINFVLIERVFTTDEVVVTGARREQALLDVPHSIAVLSTEDLTIRPIIAIDDALRSVSGVQVQGEQINVRGSSGFSFNVGSRVLLLLDGVPLLTPDVDGVPFEVLPLAQIERVEVFKGPGSALYGGGALGGVINAITKTFPASPETDVRLLSGFYEPSQFRLWRNQWDKGEERRRILGMSVSRAHQVNDRFGYWLSINVHEDQGFTNFSYRKRFSGYAKLGWQLTPNQRFDVLTGVLLREKDDFLFWNSARDALNPGSFSFTNSDTPQGTNDNRSDQVSFLPSYTRVLSSSLFYKVSGRLFGIFIRPIDNETGEPRGLNDGTFGFRYGGEVQVNYAPSASQYLTLGLTGDANTTRSSFFITNDGDRVGNQPEVAAFSQYEQTLGNLDVVAGLRYDIYRIDTEETVTKLSPKLSLRYPLSPTVSLRAAYGEGFRVPSLAERFVDNSDFFPLVQNIGLQPETSRSFEAGIRTTYPLSDLGMISWDVAAFWNDYWDLIEPKFVAEFSAFQFVNLFRARIRGFEATTTLSLFDAFVRMQAGYTFMDTEDLDAGGALPSRPPHLFKGTLDIGPWKHVYAGFDLRLASEPDRVDTDFARFVPDATLLVPTEVLDVRVGTQFRTVRLTLTLKNALNYSYLERPAFLAPPRHLLAQLQWTF